MSVITFILFAIFLIMDVTIRSKGENKTAVYILWDVFRTMFMALLCSYIFYQLSASENATIFGDLMQFPWKIVSWLKEHLVAEHTLLALYILCFSMTGLVATIFEYDFITGWNGIETLFSNMFPYIAVPILIFRNLWLCLVLQLGRIMNPKEENNPYASKQLLMECVSYLMVMIVQFVLALILRGVVYNKPIIFLVLLGGYCLVYLAWGFIFKVFSAAASLPGGKLEEYNNMRLERHKLKWLYIITSDISVVAVFFLTIAPCVLWFYEMWYA